MPRGTIKPEATLEIAFNPPDAIGAGRRFRNFAAMAQAENMESRLPAATECR
jgi:hypothetical protein